MNEVMNEIVSNKFYIIFLIINIFIVVTNYKNLNNPKPYPPKEIREEFKKGKFGFDAYKYRGFSHYAMPRLVKSESNWKDGYHYWNKAFIKIGVIGIVITLITMLLGEVFNLYIPFIGISIILLFLISGMIFVSYRMEKDILKD